ncbi:hypothetical protein BLA60_04250 [Actinophytocola xinjiangensis]|uniref:Aldehyde oxidase/xanthine dehydrogenase a/b hammerhead domain-containing protein n=1 Tax=Actinophytocola xinjiangensis TaxID=485602 RepID=A0A7Z0WUJ6_9PSEU|nr:xanthine dehydrogenase family protein molybdopterin-binding subunit [Actinophytocola xinjiangensis]OLF14346.1 hypothetical protein BLA60_04250 [Actinophytocola xinjiangensis]
MTNSPIGSTLNRVDGPDKVTGAARYAGDESPTGLVHGHLVLATIGNGTIRSMDTGAARDHTGVLEIYTPDNPLPLHGVPPGVAFYFSETRRPLSDHEVRYHGQIVGLVIAETPEQARDAAALITVDYERRPANASFRDNVDDAVVPEPTPLPMGLPITILADGVPSIDAALAASPVTVTATYTHPARHHNALEPHAAVATWDGDRLTIHSTTQAPAAHAIELAQAFAVPADHVHVVNPHVGGGFGGKAFTWGPTYLAAAAARRLGRPVKVVPTREQLHTTTGHRSAAHQTVTLGSSADGTLNAIRHLSVTQAIGEDPGTRLTMKAYATENLHVSLRVTTGLNVPTTTILRAPGEETGSFAIECAMDELAIELGLDPIELRTRNHLTHTLSPDPATRLPYSNKHLIECYRLGARRFGWDTRNPAPRSTLATGGWLVGTGMAGAVLNASRAFTAVRVSFRPDGTAAVATSTADLGTGMRTVLAIMGTDSLGIPVDRIRPLIGDSRLPVGPDAVYGAQGSAATATVAPVVRDAAADAVEELINHAVTEPRSPLHGRDGVRYTAGDLTDGATTIGFGDLLTTTGGTDVGATTTSGPVTPPSYAFASHAAHFCEVRVHRLTGEIRVSRMTTVVDAGTIVNEKTARNQIVGGVVWGIGPALFESAHVEPDTGRIANANFADYLVPVNADVPDVDVVFLDHPDTNFSPLGARGLGELGTVGSAAAVANAVHHATGIRVRDLPITPEKLLTTPTGQA